MKMASKKSESVAVLISDVHFSIQNLELAKTSMVLAINKARSLKIPLIIAGDLHDTKANLRGECVNVLSALFQETNATGLRIYILIGNHDKINEKSSDHSLNFLENEVFLIPDQQQVDCFSVNQLPLHFIPYQHDPEAFRDCLKSIKKGSTIICHQGVEGSHSGDYIQDKSAINRQDVADFRVISGHYHRRQDIKCGRPQKGAVGLFSYIGNPFTLTYGEAEDPSKGFQVLYSDGILEHVPTNLRKHVVYKFDLNDPIEPIIDHKPGDLVWVKITGAKERLNRIDKDGVAKMLNLKEGFRLDLIPVDTVTEAPAKMITSQPELLDAMIDSTTNVSDEQKSRLKGLWKDLA